MIKIELNDEKREKIEKIFLEDLVDGTSRDKRQRKKGKLIEDLNNCRPLLEGDKTNPAPYHFRQLAQYLYDDTGKPNIANVKALLLADRKCMETFAGQFGPFTTKEANKLLDKVFRYTNFSNRKVVNEILREMEVPVCPYCNRLYITALKRKKVRPQLDHFFPKSKYPYLALCLYNLIPSCGVCNQAKSDLDPLDSRYPPLLYPYEEEFGEDVVFALKLKGQDDFVRKMRGDSSKIQVHIDSSSSKLKLKVDQQVERLHLAELYNEHGDYVADILKSYHINTEARVVELIQCFPDLFTTRDEVRSLMFMSDISRERWGRRPLAKLTHDIYFELDNLPT